MASQILIFAANYTRIMLPEKEFEFRHLGPRNEDINEMLKIIGIDSIEQLISETVKQI